MPDDELKLSITSDTPETRGTLSTFREMLAFPKNLATGFAMNLAVYSWAFNQITQPVRLFYDWWMAKNAAIGAQINEHLQMLQKAVSTLPTLGPQDIPALQRADIRMARDIGGAFTAKEVAEVRRAVGDVLSVRLAERVLPWAGKLAQAYPQIDKVALAKMMAPMLTAYGYSEEQAAGMSAGILREASGSAPELAGMFGRQGAGMRPYLAGGMQDMVYWSALFGAGGMPSLRSGTMITRGLQSLSQLAQRPGTERYMEETLGADVF